MNDATPHPLSGEGTAANANRSCCGSGCGCSVTAAAPIATPLPRRRFLQLSGLTLAAVAAGALPETAVAGPFVVDDFINPIPADKKLRPEWVRSLFARGAPDVYQGADLEKIGMPVGGLCCGMLYLGGDGRLWLWDIFNRIWSSGGGGPNYAQPLTPTAPLNQGFALRIQTGDQAAQERPLDRTGWKEVSFTGQYPIGTVDYRDPDCPVTVRLDAFSPFVPLETDDSSLPVTLLEYTITNTSSQPITADLAGWIENAVCLHTGQRGEALRRNRTARTANALILECQAEPDPGVRRATPRADIPFDDFERETYAPWSVTGTAFGDGPVETAKMPSYVGPVQGHGKRVVNTHHFRQGADAGAADRHVGTLTSPEFTITRDYISFLVGGGSHTGKTCVNLLIDGKVVASVTGRDSNVMSPASFYTRTYDGQQAQIQVVDNETGGWGQIAIDHIVFTDRPSNLTPLTERHDFGTMNLALLAPASEDRAITSLPNPRVPAGVFGGADGAARSMGPDVKPIGDPLIGAVSRTLRLKAGESQKVTFTVAWHFPNIYLEGLPNQTTRHYGRRFRDARAVVDYVAKNYARLAKQTRLWRDTWYDSTLPYWFLDRTFASASTPATTTCYRFADGRFYAWEGVGCCVGTCTHVWHYAHALGRLFPELERDLRERTDYKLAFDPSTGLIHHRGTHGAGLAVDGQAGIILRTLREHQMSPDDKFLRRVWPEAKKALAYLVQLDKDGDSIVDGPQHNTYDGAWFGKIAWISGLYLAALRAGEEMAREIGDRQFAEDCRRRFEIGRKSIDTELYNGEYYIQISDPANREAVGSFDACFADQVFGQSWANQVALGPILDQGKVKSALEAIWRYNFTPDIGAWRGAHPAGRWYAMPGEAGLVLANWPKGDKPAFSDRPGSGAYFAMYFNESWTGFEYQVAGHMLAAGMLTEGLALVRAVHDRYHPGRRNPYNEIECSDHYARAMASYGAYIAACGYRYHGPRGHLAFAPKLSPENFKAAFTAAEGWGTYTQQNQGANVQAGVHLRQGRLRLTRLSVGSLPAGATAPKAVQVTINGKAIPARLAMSGGEAQVNFAEGITLQADDRLEVRLTAA